MSYYFKQKDNKDESDKFFGLKISECSKELQLRIREMIKKEDQNW